MIPVRRILKKLEEDEDSFYRGISSQKCSQGKAVSAFMRDPGVIEGSGCREPDFCENNCFP